MLRRRPRRDDRGHAHENQPDLGALRDESWGGDEATILAHDAGRGLYGFRASAAGAAFANGNAANGLDLDDSARYAYGHAGAQIFPTALAVGEALDRSGAEILAAIGGRIRGSAPHRTLLACEPRRCTRRAARGAASRALRWPRTCCSLTPGAGRPRARHRGVPRAEPADDAGCGAAGHGQARHRAGRR